MDNGYVSYQRRNEETGLENQCWKDSWDSISYRNGKLPGVPARDLRAPGLRLRRQRCAALVWRGSSGRTTSCADRLEREAADLKRRFNRDFWVEDGGYFALALDTKGNQVDALTSNNGHLLWSGIVDKSKAKAVAEHLLGPRLFSGWGVRTLAEGEGRYNPIGYHVGTVWPFDNSFIAWGLRRYGFKEEAAEIASGILDAAEFFDGRLPEAFGGYDRAGDEVPRAVPDRVQPAGLVDRGAAAPAADDARARAARRAPRRRSGAAERHRPARAARHPGPLGPHRRVRTWEGGYREEAREEAMSQQQPAPADVFVVFGITGDLARVMTFRSLYRLERRGLLDCPIVGVAVDDWTLDQLIERARDVDRRDRRAARRGDLQAVRRPALVHLGRLRGCGHLQARWARRSRERRRPSSISRSRRSCSAWS